MRHLTILFLLAVFVFGCNDHVAQTAEISQPVVILEADILGRTINMPSPDGQREIHLSGTLKNDLSTAEHKVYCAGDISNQGMLARNHRWRLDNSGALPVIILNSNWSETRLTVDSISGDRLLVRRGNNHNYHATHLGISLQPEQLTDFGERTLFFDLLNSGQLMVTLPAAHDDYPVRRIENQYVDNAIIYAPDDLTGLEVSFEQNGRYAIFSGDRIMREGAFTPSKDGQWLILDGGSTPDDYWKIRYYDGQTVRLETVIKVITELDEHETQYTIRPLQLRVTKTPNL